VPLYTDDINRARVAYTALEGRLADAERRTATLQAQVDELVSREPEATADVALLRRRIVQLESEKLELIEQRDELAAVKAEMKVADLVREVGRAAAAGEATMPDRTIRSLAVTVRGHLAPAEEGIGLRFQPPELGSRTAGLASTSLELAKVPPPPDEGTPPNLAAVLLAKQALYADPRWSGAEPARLVTAISRTLAGAASVAELVSAAAEIAELEGGLAAGLSGVEAESYRAAVHVLVALVDAIAAKPEPSAGDVLALAAGLEATTQAARRLPLLA
jgi:hypothetical protein